MNILLLACCLLWSVTSAAAAGTANLSVTPTSLSFGNVIVGSAATLPLTVTSNGTSPLTINSVAVKGAGFSVPGVRFPLTLNPGQTAMLEVRSAAYTIGAITGTLTIRSNSPTNPSIAILLTGTGVARTIAQLRISPNSLNFGNVTVGSAATLPVSVTSTGTAPLTIGAPAITGVFTVSGVTFPVTLSPKQTVTINVTSTPKAAGTTAGVLSISSNAIRHNRIAIRLISTGVAQTSPQLTVSPASLNFGNVKIGTTATRPVTLTSSGTGPLTISSRAITGAGFTVSGVTFPITLNPKQAVTLNVRSTPKAASKSTGTLTISSNALRHSGIAVGLTSNGVSQIGPQVTVSPDSLSFGMVNDGASAVLPVTLVSTGTTPVSITSATIKGTGFTVSGATFPVTLNPTLAITLMVQFSPTAGVAMAGTLTIGSNSSDGPSTVVNLSGSGQYVVNLNWEAPRSSPDPVAGYDIYRSAKGSSSYQLINSSGMQTTYVDNSVESGSIYSYYVKSVDRSGVQSSPSNTAGVTIP
ncbi:choice-of-anchor D domain-containing protein [Alloacidobacterium sp.]|uniref:choice-of-anchor D domain-containing protein n=1 Tax=Alloacidobacterium sp. TaxID=2951999 RepID=UPI002D3BFB85|nr:choice-of-anchor D domain-containing protein [Alloacidobacterium sp.]HYK34818.1 choice-of-anchor D domain-containing protein [Alloacidobacterium sp.]